MLFFFVFFFSFSLTQRTDVPDERDNAGAEREYDLIHHIAHNEDEIESLADANRVLVDRGLRGRAEGFALRVPSFPPVVGALLPPVV